MERVSTISGKLPIIVIAPHGFDGNDENTAIIAEQIAKSINAYAVVNRGWERDENVDYMLDKADCNNVYHCHEDVVKEEFLEPIFRFKNRILQSHPKAYLYYIHGMGNRHRDIAGDDSMDVVLGFGAGYPDHYTCELWQKDLICHLLIESGINTFEGKKGGSMSGWSRGNMNQLFRKWYFEPNVSSMQLEIVHELRSCKDMASLTAEYIGEAISFMLGIKSFSPEKAFNSY